MKMISAKVNALIKPLGVKLVAARSGTRLLGYSYFTSLKTGEQIGQSVMVYRQNQLTLDRWVTEAKGAIEEHCIKHGNSAFRNNNV